MSSHTRYDRIRNECMKERVGIAPIVEKIVESHLRWFGYVWRRPIGDLVRSVNPMEDSTITRGRAIPTKTIGETVKRDLHANG